MNYFNEAIMVMKELYGRDVAMSLATVNGEKPNARVINAYFKADTFYVTSYSLSNKMKEIAKNPRVALNHICL
jgi:uncharacterized pyridoxamine 5'-phosphate oxidase family protein